MRRKSEYPDARDYFEDLERVMEDSEDARAQRIDPRIRCIDGCGRFALTKETRCAVCKEYNEHPFG